MKPHIKLAAAAALIAAMTACGDGAREGDIMSNQQGNQTGDPFGQEPEVMVPDDADFGDNSQPAAEPN